MDLLRVDALAVSDQGLKQQLQALAGSGYRSSCSPIARGS